MPFLTHVSRLIVTFLAGVFFGISSIGFHRIQDVDLRLVAN